MTVCNFALHRMHHGATIFVANSQRMRLFADACICTLEASSRMHLCQTQLVFYQYQNAFNHAALYIVHNNRKNVAPRIDMGTDRIFNSPWSADLQSVFLLVVVVRRRTNAFSPKSADWVRLFYKPKKTTKSTKTKH